MKGSVSFRGVRIDKEMLVFFKWGPAVRTKKHTASATKTVIFRRGRNSNIIFVWTTISTTSKRLFVLPAEAAAKAADK